MQGLLDPLDPVLLSSVKPSKVVLCSSRRAHDQAR
jgi:hypothetical protein